MDGEILRVSTKQNNRWLSKARVCIRRPETSRWQCICEMWPDTAHVVGARVRRFVVLDHHDYKIKNKETNELCKQTSEVAI